MLHPIFIEYRAVGQLLTVVLIALLEKARTHAM